MKVYPNPWGVHPLALSSTGCVPHSLDRHGYPTHRVMVERLPGTNPGQVFVGAKIASAVVTDHRSNEEKRSGAVPLGSPPQTTIWSFLGVRADAPDFCDRFSEREPVEVPETAYYLGALRSGDLLPGDGRSASLAKYQCKPELFSMLEAKARQSAGIEAAAPPAPPATTSTDATKPKKGNG